MTIIDLSAERDKRNGPDEEFVRYDEHGRKLFAYCLDYRMDDAYWTTTIWAYSFEDAERRAEAMRQGVAVSGQIYSTIPA